MQLEARRIIMKIYTFVTLLIALSMTLPRYLASLSHTIAHFLINKRSVADLTSDDEHRVDRDSTQSLSLVMPFWSIFCSQRAIHRYRFAIAIRDMLSKI